MLNLLLVGYGKIGKIHAKSIIESESAKLSGIVDPNLDNKLKNTNNVKIYNDISEVKLDKQIDGVIISSTTHSHYSIAKKIINYKIPILIEKPLSINLKEVKSITKASLEKEVVLQAGFVETYNPVVNYIKNCNLENIEEVEIFRFSEPALESRNLENVLHDLAIHDISVFDFLYTLDNLNIVNSETENYDNKISTAKINFIAGDINVNLNVSNRAENKIRTWKIKTESNLYEIDFLNKKITTITKNNDSQLVELEGGTLPIDAQLNSFIRKINTNFIDIKHMNSIDKCHEFISLIT